MRQRILAAILIAAAAAAPASARQSASAHPPQHSGDGSRVITVATRADSPQSQRITLALNKAAIVQLDTDARDVLVSNPEMVDAVVRTPRRIFLLAQKIGQTNAFFFDAAGHQILSIDIRVERDVADLASMIHADVADSSVRVAALNDNIVLTGSVANSKDAAMAQDLAGRFVGDPTKVVNMLKVAAHEQVMLKVRVAEVQRQIAKQLGINLSTAVIADGVPIAMSTQNPFGLVGRALSALSGGRIGQVCTSGAIPLSGSDCTVGPNNLQGSLQALETVGLVHTLAEPNLTAVSGETAKFLAGGEFPVPVSRDQFGNVVVDFKQFGVGLSFTPIVLSENRISLQISTEVSELTNEGAFLQQASTSTDPTTGTQVTTAGLAVPALAVRRAETTVELPSGGSFAVAGLLQHTTKQEIDAFPGLKDMPVLGALFRSRDFQNNETELVVLVSAYLVSPTHETKIALPTDGFVPAADVDTVLMGRLNTVYKRTPTALSAPGGGGGNVGFIVE